MADLSIIRDKEWLFQTLWSAVNSSKRGAKIKIVGFKVPVTFIVFKGRPVKCVSCAEGPVASVASSTRGGANSTSSSASNNAGYTFLRKHIMDDDGDVFSLRNSSARGLNGNAFRYVRWMRSKLMEFQRQFIDDSPLSSTSSAEGKETNIFKGTIDNAGDDYDYERLKELVLCTVTYSDGAREDIDLKSFDMLIRNDYWRSQLVLIQGYVPSRPLADCCGAAGGTEVISRDAVEAYNSNDTSDAASGSTATGFFKKKAVGFAARAEGSSSSSGDRKTPLDEHTASLAELVRLAYDGDAGRGDGEDSVHTAASSRLTAETTYASGQVEVSTMHGIYTRYFDSRSKMQSTYLLYSDYVLIQFKNFRREIEDMMTNEKMSREMLSANFVVKELLVILQWAQRRGTATYAHFDPSKSGYIDCQGFIDGLAKIGIGVTADVARCAIQCISGVGEKYIFKDDFFAFINNKSVCDFDDLAEYTFGNDDVNTHENLTYLKKKQSRANKLRNRPSDNVISDKLELDAIITKMVPRLNQSRDQLLHVGGGLVLTYRLLSHRALQAEDLGERKETAVEEAPGDERAAGEDADANANCFTLVLFPDLFMTLQSLEDRVKRLCHLYPQALLLLVGLPGMPNTVWPRSHCFDSRSQAACAAKLIDFLDRKQKLSLFAPPAEQGAHSYLSVDNSPIFLAGFGSGVHTMARYVVEHLCARSRARLRVRVKFIATINGKLQHDYSYKKICKGLLDLLSSTRFREDAASPVHDLIMSLHFSEAFLSRSDPEQVFERFWKPRRALHSDSLNGGGGQRAGYTGLQELLRGILYPPEGDSFDGRQLLEAISAPIVVVQSTENLFVTPEYTVMFQDENLPASRSLVDGLEKCGSNCVALQWLGAGHEVLDERNPFVLSLFSSFARLVGANPDPHPTPNPALETAAPPMLSPAPEVRGGSAAAQERKEEEEEEEARRGARFNLITRTALRQKEKMDRAARRRVEVSARMRTSSFVEESLGENEGDSGVDMVGELTLGAELPVVLSKDAVDELRTRVEATVAAVGRKATAPAGESVSMLSDLQGLAGCAEVGPGRQSSLSTPTSTTSSATSSRVSLQGTPSTARKSMRASNSESRKSILEDRVVETRAERIAKRRQKEAEESVIAEEKRRQAMKQQRRQEVAELKERARAEAARKAEFKELREMANEEARCRIAWELAEQMRVKVCVYKSEPRRRPDLFQAHKLELARKKADERSARKQAEAERKRSEEKRLYRIARLRERQQYVDGLARTVCDFRRSLLSNAYLKNTDPVRLQEELEPAGRRGDSEQLIAAVSTAVEALSAAWLDKVQLIEVLVCSDELEGKMAKYKHRVEALDTETKRLERAILLLTLNPSLVGLNDGQHEIEDLHRTLAKRATELAHLKSNYHERVQQLKAFKLRAHHFRQVFQESAKATEETLTQLTHLEQHLTTVSRGLKTRLDKLSREKERLLFAKKSHKERLRAVEAEAQRIKGHAHKYVDTNIWVEGANTRALTEELRKHLAREKTVYLENIRRADQEIDDLGAQIAEVNTGIATNKKYQVLLSQSRKYFKQAYAVFDAIEPEKTSSELFAYLGDTIRKEKTREKARLLAKQATTIGAVSDMDVLRMKDMELRSDDEKRFIGMDLILNPHAYQHLKMRDIEEMRVDPAYSWNLKKIDLERIYKLPDQVGLALPFLYTKEEVCAHRLINAFIRGIDDEYFRARDRESEDVIDAFNDAAGAAAGAAGATAAGAHRAGKVDAEKDVNDSETANFVALKESQAYSSRCNTDRSSLTDEDRRWLQIDRLLSPHLYLDVSGMTMPGSRRHSPSGSPSVSPSGSPKLSLHKRISLPGPPASGPALPGGLTRDRLLHLYYNLDKRSASGDDDDDGLKGVAAILDNYYVGPDESSIGFARVKCLSAFCLSVAKAVVSMEGDDASAERAQQQHSSAASDIQRVWGGWQEVHPASAGADSQKEYFFKAACNVTRDHPAAFAIHPAKAEEQGDGLETFLLDDALTTVDPSLAFKALLALPGTVIADGLPHPIDKRRPARDDSQWFIARSLEELSATPRHRFAGKVVLVELPDKEVIFEERSAELGARASRSYKFEVSDKQDSRVLNFTVSVVYQGEFNGRGYSLGRMAAGLFRVPGRNDRSRVPVPVGYCPYDLQQPNTPDGLGRIAVLHFPSKVPFSGGTYQLVLGCAANTRFSVEVSATVGKVALSVIDSSVERAKSLQSVLPRMVSDLALVKESLYLADRKIGHCRNLIAEAQTESETANRHMKESSRRIQQDDEEMVLTDEERRSLEEESRAYTYDYGYWTKLLSSRSQEEADIGRGAAALKEQLAALDRKVSSTKAELAKLRRVIPPSMALVRSFTEACQVAQSLNADMDELVQISGAENSSNENRALVISTPAEAVRRKHKDDGFDSLILEEQQWTLLDQALNPEKYEWQNAVDDEKKRTVHYSAVVESFRLSKVEVEQLLLQPTSMLSRHNMVVRKLLMKYHDDPQSMKKQMVIKAGFDPHLAERVRIKSYFECSLEEKEWIGVDRVLHPEIWAFVTNVSSGQGSIDKHAELATVGGVKNRVNEVAQALGERERAAKRVQEGADKESKLAGAVSREAKKKVAAVQKLGKIMGMADNISEEAEDAVGLDVADIAASVRRKGQRRERSKGVWVCDWPKDRILEVWRTPKHHLKLDLEKKVSALLHRFNGTYASYLAYSEYARRRQLKAKLPGSHIRHDERSKNLSKDTDLLVRQVYRELQRIQNTSAHVVDTDVLQGNNQRFPRELLKGHLERQLDYYLVDQIKDRERSARYEVASSDEEVSSDEDGDVEMKKFLKKMKKKAILKANPTLDKNRDPNEKRDAKKQKVRSVTALAEQALSAELGPQGCIACRSNPCRWETSVDMAVCTDRINVLSMEIERVRNDRESQLIESSVALSAMLGGNTSFLRLDLLYELNSELSAVQRAVNLNAVDKELHDAYSSLKESMEVRALHGYPMLLWVNNARVALEQRQSRLCAEVVAHEICDDILDWMLEGWYFGERVSDYTIMGYIPSMKQGSRIRAGLDQVTYSGVAASRLNRRYLAQKHNYLIDEQRRGVATDKAQFVERHAQARIEAESLKKDFEANDHSLNVVENTLKYFIFTCTLMYFRSMALVTREKRSWSDSDGGKKAVTTERLRMISEQSNYAARVKRIGAAFERGRRGEQAKRDRDIILRRDAIMRRIKIASERHLKDDSCRVMQRVYRGFIGRRNAKIWAVKRAELEAMNALLHQTAIVIQRTYRRYLARVLLDETRKEMAQFIAFLRDQEAKQDEEQYWQTHNYNRRKRDAKAFYERNFLPKKVGEARDAAEEEEEEEVAGYDLESDSDEGEALPPEEPADLYASAKVNRKAPVEKAPADKGPKVGDEREAPNPTPAKSSEKKPAATSFSSGLRMLNPFAQREPEQRPLARKAEATPSALFRRTDGKRQPEVTPTVAHTSRKITRTMDAEELTMSVQRLGSAGDEEGEEAPAA